MKALYIPTDDVGLRTSIKAHNTAKRKAKGRAKRAIVDMLVEAGVVYVKEQLMQSIAVDVRFPDGLYTGPVLPNAREPITQDIAPAWLLRAVELAIRSGKIDTTKTYTFRNSATDETVSGVRFFEVQ